MSLLAMLNPRSVAVIGASDDKTRIGGRPISYMLSQKYSGEIFAVNPTRQTIQGLPAYASVASLRYAPEVAVVAVAASNVVATISELARIGTKIAIVFSAGFAEIGDDGLALQQAMLAAAGPDSGSGLETKLRILGPNALGVVNPRNGFFGSFISSVELGMPKPGRVAIISQSGAYGGHLLSAATANNIGLSACVMTGNEADISLGEVIQTLVNDDDTDVIALYSEGIREASKFISALESARQAHKPVVMMKVGRSKVGSRAAQSHTASIAGNDKVINAVLKEFGVLRASNTEHLLDVARLATRKIFPVNNALGVVTVSGGAGVIVSDAAEDVGLPLPEMPFEAQTKLKELLAFASPRNPVDVTAQFLNDMNLVGQFTEVMVRDGGYTSILAFFTYTGGAVSVAPKLRQQLKAVRDRYPDRLYVLVVQASKAQIADYEADGFSVFEDPTRAVNAIAAMGRFGEAFFKQEAAQLSSSPAASTPPVAPSFQQRTFNEHQAKALLKPYGIASPAEHVCHNAAEAIAAARELGYPVVMKILSDAISHKSDVGGVLLNINSDKQVSSAFERLQNIANGDVLVVRQLSGGVECIAGIHRDPVFGPVLMFGLGGVFVEILEDITLHRCPVNRQQAFAMTQAIRGAPLLRGARGAQPVDLEKLAELLVKLSEFAIACGPDLNSIDINPVLARADGAYALDAVINFQKQNTN